MRRVSLLFATAALALAACGSSHQPAVTTGTGTGHLARVYSQHCDITLRFLASDQPHAPSTSGSYVKGQSNQICRGSEVKHQAIEVILWEKWLSDGNQHMMAWNYGYLDGPNLTHPSTVPTKAIAMRAPCDSLDHRRWHIEIKANVAIQANGGTTEEPLSFNYPGFPGYYDLPCLVNSPPATCGPGGCSLASTGKILPKAFHDDCNIHFGSVDATYPLQPRIVTGSAVQYCDHFVAVQHFQVGLWEKFLDDGAWHLMNESPTMSAIGGMSVSATTHANCDTSDVRQWHLEERGEEIQGNPSGEHTSSQAIENTPTVSRHCLVHTPFHLPFGTG